jgi:hypothetical protein
MMKNTGEINYEMYLFSNLLKLYKTGFDDLTYDDQYDLLLVLYDEYFLSKFNVGSRGVYICMEQYLDDKYGAKDPHPFVNQRLLEFLKDDLIKLDNNWSELQEKLVFDTLQWREERSMQDVDNFISYWNNHAKSLSIFEK